MRVSVTSSAITWTITCPSSLRAANCVYSNPWIGKRDPQSFLDALRPFLLCSVTPGTSVLWVWPWVGTGSRVDTGCSPEMGFSSEPGVAFCFCPNLTKVLMYRVVPCLGLVCANLMPFPQRVGSYNGKCPVLIGPVEQLPFGGREIIIPLVYPWSSGYPRSL